MAKELNIEPKLIDIEGLMNGTVDIKGITYEVMLADALARKSRDGIQFLRENYGKLVERKIKKTGKVISAKNSLGVYRSEYLHEYTPYKTKNELASEKRTILNRNKDIEDANNLADLALSMLDEEE